MINDCQIKTYDADRSATVPQQYRKGAYLLRALLRTPWLDRSKIVLIAMSVLATLKLGHNQERQRSRVNSLGATRSLSEVNSSCF